MSKFIREYDVHQVDIIAKECAELLKDISVITLTGSLGAGKTTLTAAILRHWGVTEPVMSPTFTYVNSYQLADGRRAYHFDLYRLDDLGAFAQAGFDEYLYQEGSVCLVEWPEIIDPLLTKSVARIAIEFMGVDKRQLECEIKI